MDYQVHGGDIYRNVISCDFSVNTNPLGMPSRVKELLCAAPERWERYPDPECEALTRALARYHDVAPEQILCANGAADLIYHLVQARKPRRALVLAPSFSEYEAALDSVGCRVEHEPLLEAEGFVVSMERLTARITGDVDMVFFCNPNNPTGIPVEKEAIEELAKACHRSRTFLVVDECFCEFLDAPWRCSAVSLVRRYPQMFLLRAFTKTYAMAGLRLGYGICGEKAVLQAIRRVRQPWSVSLPAQEAGVEALLQTEYLEQTRSLLRTQRPLLRAGLEQMGFVVYGGETGANYLLFQVPGERSRTSDANLGQDSLYEACKKRGILIRDCRSFTGIGAGFYRICIRRQEENLYLLEQLRQIADRNKGERQP